ncbi:MAG: response regulator [Desulfobulbaceae bacterium]|nr:response regulator [Desulfobulbaceae bacterium]
MKNAGIPPHRGKILVVDAVKADLKQLTDLLTEQNYIVHPASNSALAHEFISSTLPDLILLSIRMPEMDGFEVCRRLKAQQRTCRIPIIFITILEDEQDKIKAFRAGGVDYIPKPFHPEEVLARIKTHMKLRELTVRKEQEGHYETEETASANQRFQEEHIELLRADDETKLLHCALDHVHEGAFLIDYRGKFLYVNQEACRSLEYEKNELIGKSITEIDPDFTMEEFDEHFNYRLKLGALTFETRHRSRSGRIFPVEITSNLFEFGGTLYSLSLTRDISERKRFIADLQESRSILQAILNSIPVRVFWKNKKLEFLGCNTPFAKDAGFETAEQVIGKDDYAMSWREQAELYRADDCGVIESGKDKLHIEEPQTTPSGEQIHLLTSKVPLRDSDGEIIGVLGTYQDITERKKLEGQLQQAQKMEAIGTLAGGIAHDFNNMLSAIIGYTELAKCEIDNSENLQKYLEQVFKAGERAKELVKQILTFSRSSNQELQPLKIQLVIKEALKLLRSSLPSTIKINTDINPDCEAILADPIQIHQVIMNLCTNAYHAMRETGGILSVSLEPIQLSADPIDNKIQLPAGSYLKLEISDTGQGIPREVQDRIFEPYYTTKGKGEGTGLGLAVVHGIITRLHGDIKVYSDKNKGAKFRICLPVSASYAESIQQKTPTHFPTGNEKILLVDDDVDLVQMTQKILESLGYQVTAFTSSLDALKKFHQEPYNFDLVITDMTMPNMTGAKLAEQILTIRPDTKIILCTGFSDLINEKKARAIGIRDYIMKPLTKNDLALAVRKVLDVS